MRLVLIDDHARTLVNATLVRDDDEGDAYSYKEGCTILNSQDLTRCESAEDLNLFAEFKAAIGYLGVACISTLVDRLKQLPIMYSTMAQEEGQLANDLIQAISSVNSAYHQIKGNSPSIANSLAKISIDIQNTYSNVGLAYRDDTQASLEFVPHGSQVPQPHGLSKTFMRQRPKETWTQTARRVLGEDGAESFQELIFNNEELASVAAKELLTLKQAIVSWDTRSLESAATNPGGNPTRQTFFGSPFTLPPSLGSQEHMGKQGFSPSMMPRQDSPLNAQAKPFTPGGQAQPPSAPRSMVASSQRHAPMQQSSSMRPPPGLFPIPQFQQPSRSGFAAGPYQFTDSFRIPAQSECTYSALAPNKTRMTTHELSDNPFSDFSPPPSAQAASSPASRRELDPGMSHLQEGVTHSPRSQPQATTETQQPAQLKSAADSNPGAHTQPRISSPLYEISGPGSPSYQTWAQKAAGEADDGGEWTTVLRAKKPAAKPPTQIPFCQGTTQCDAVWVAVTGLRRNITLSEVTEVIETGPLVSVTIDRQESSSSATAHIVFLHLDNARQLIHQNSTQNDRHKESLYGPGVEIQIGPRYTGPENLTGMLRLANASGRNDAGFGFERRRLTFAGTGLSLTKEKIYKCITKQVGIHRADIETVHVFNPGNATVIFANVASARRVKNVVTADKREWRDCRVAYSSDPCEKHATFLQRQHDPNEPEMREMVRRAYQKAQR